MPEEACEISDCRLFRITYKQPALENAGCLLLQKRRYKSHEQNHKRDGHQHDRHPGKYFRVILSYMARNSQNTGKRRQNAIEQGGKIIQLTKYARGDSQVSNCKVGTNKQISDDAYDQSDKAKIGSSCRFVGRVIWFS